MAMHRQQSNAHESPPYESDILMHTTFFQLGLNMMPQARVSCAYSLANRKAAIHSSLLALHTNKRLFWTGHG